jgi:cyclohexanecarboxylate-CoA ligase
MPELTLPAQIMAGAAAHDSCPLTFVGADGLTEFETTLGALVSDAARVAGGLQARGIGPGHVVAVQLPGSYEGAVAQAAVSMCGAVLLPVVMIYGPREMGFLLRQSSATAVFAPRAYRGREHASVVLGGLPDLPALKFAVVVGDDAPPYGAVSYADLAGRLAAPYRRPAPDPDDRAMLVYTSGTTADPKGVQHSHRSLLAEATSRVIRDSGPQARQLGLFPPGHIAGLLSLLRLLLQAIPTITMETWDPAVAARLIDRYHVTASVGAPVQLSGLLDLQASGMASLATLREFMTGAAAVPPNLIRRADAAGITAYRTYGSSEHPTVSTGTVADSLEKRATTDGMLITGNEIRIIDSAGRDVPAGREGEIASRGPELFIGYTDPALDAQAFLPGGWYRTGDVGRLDADGYLTITDRLKDIIIRGGENISSAEVEDLLITHPAVAEVAVIPAPDPAIGERVCAVVVPVPGLSFGIDEARAHFAAAGVARQKTPEVIVVVEELPRTPSGKVRKEVLRAQLAARPARQSG